MTYSLIGRDPTNGEVGAAVQSKFPGVGSIVLHGNAEAGCITTQAFANPRHGEIGLKLLSLGATATEVLTVLLRTDDNCEERQIALLGMSQPPTAFTGVEVQQWDGFSGHMNGADCVASGNCLAGKNVLEAMIAAFGIAPGDLSDRLVAGLRAGRDAGGELRGQQSAALLVVKSGGGYGGQDGRHVDISVYDHPAPIEELHRCLELHRLSYFPTDPKNLIEIDGPIARELKNIMRIAGFHDFPDTPNWEHGEISTFQRFMGRENYDNRLRSDRFVDLEVLHDLKGRFAIQEYRNVSDR
ncbi:MAG: DUF1028 domain-containing protein [Thiohalocapsa sp.]